MIEPNESSESMRYGMIGDDTASTSEKLGKYMGDADWEYLKPHFEAGALVYVDPSLDLKAVGEAFAEDVKEKVQGWLKSGDLVQPSQLHANHWESSKSRFTALVVSPFVLIQPL